MKALLKNPFTLWLKWYLRSKMILIKNKDKNLKIGYMAVLANVNVGKYNTIYDNVIVGNSTIGNYVYIANGSKISNTLIGNFCSIGPNVLIGLGMHPTSLVSTSPVFFSTRKQCQITFTDKNYFEEFSNVKIGNDVWIGSNAIIMGNITIGDGAIIGAGAVVNRDVEPYCIVAGVPAKLIKKRFSDDKIKLLMEIKWWDKDQNWLKENQSLFVEPEKFFNDIMNS